MGKLSILILSFCSKVALAQLPATSNWFALQLLVNRGSKWEWVNDAGYRTLGMSASAYAYEGRTGMRYRFNETWNVATGTALFFTRSSFQKYNHEFGREFRLWQELSFHKPLSKDFLFHERFRTEERWFGAVTNKDAYFGLRLRERLTVTKSLTQTWSLEFGDEYLRMLSDKKFLFNANRILLLALYKFKGDAQLQGGYMWVKLPVSSQHVFTFTFQKMISIHGKKNNT
ncbi:MAG: DUF2490 domain-containing protein [Bacteroidetes bacterium]|nr:MAG: DUF2490 domain-containing protein [Bacteroidota bacterium]